MSELPATPPPELETLGDYIRWAASRFQAAGLRYGHGTDNALDEAAALVLAILALPPDLHAAYFPCRLTAAERVAVLEAVRERVDARRPLPYITGEAWFCGLSFRVDERVLIPRSPIAELIEAGFQPWLAPGAVRTVADVGTGSGCIAVASALAFPQAEVYALDIAEPALELARENARRHGVAERVHCRRSDLLEALPAGDGLDLIVSNPPYVDSAAMAVLPPEYRHEPRNALAAGAEGLDFVRRLLPQAAARLGDHGILVCEVGHSRPALEAAYPQLPFTWVELERGGTGVFIADAALLRREFRV